MPSDSKKKRDAKKKEMAKKRNGMPHKRDEPITTNGVKDSSATNGVEEGLPETAGIEQELDHLDLAGEYRAVTGVLKSHPDARNIQIISMAITFHGVEILVDSTVELNNGHRYGLVGVNGCGKSTFMTALGRREVPIPEHCDIFHLRREMPASDKTALQCVMDVDAERVKLEKEAEILSLKTSDEAHELLMDIYERLDEMDADKALAKAGYLLHGLGFTKEMQHRAVKHFSGGWRMRIALARALFLKPALLLLDEPTNHLDLEACVWLEEELRNYKRILVIVSHSQDFMNGVCTNIIHMSKKKLTYYKGNYDMYVKTRLDLEENQMKQYRWEQDQIAHMKNYIARFGHGSAKLAKQAQSKEKTLKKMVDGGLTERVTSEKSVSFCFLECGKIPPPVVMVQDVSFKYDKDKPYIYKNLEFGIDLDTRLALVGPNGAGKSTLLKLLCGELEPTDGLIRKNSHLRIGRYHQHLQDILDMDSTALRWMMSQFPEIKEPDDMRRIIGRYGLSGQQQVCPIKNLSDGQRCRIIFAWLAWKTPHMLLLDEPTNHLDMETIDALADAINEFEGGVLLVSHDFRLISQVAEEIWVCAKQTVTKWQGDIFSYKKSLIEACEREKLQK